MRILLAIIFLQLSTVVIFATEADSSEVIKSQVANDSTDTSADAGKKNKIKSDNIFQRLFLNAGGTYGPETVMGPEVSVDYFPFKECSLYCGLQLGFGFPAATLSGNFGAHAGFKLGPVFFETSFTAYTQASTQNSTWSEHYTTNIKIGFEIYSFYFKFGPGYYLRGDPFSSQIFLEIDGIPINFELGGSWSFEELTKKPTISTPYPPYPPSIFDVW